MTSSDECSILECTNCSYMKGWCRRHYYASHRYGSPAAEMRESHNKTGSSEYNSWANMIARCSNKRLPDYEHYGGRGIRVCKGWRDSFTSFYSDMKTRPSLKYSIDRIDNNGHYSCGHCTDCTYNGWDSNCRWATKTQQCLNRHMSSHNSSGYIGVVFKKANNKWNARISLYGKRMHLGYYNTPEEAAYIRDQFMLQIFGTDVTLNFLDN